MGGRNFHDILEKRVWRRNITIHQIFIKGFDIDRTRNARFKDRFDFGTKDQLLTIPIVIQRFLAEAIACSQEFLSFSVPKGERKHATKMQHTIISIFFVRVNDDLGVAIGGKAVTKVLQLFLKLAIVVYFPIEDDKNTPIFVKNGLMSTPEVNNREAAHTQCNSIT